MNRLFLFACYLLVGVAVASAQTVIVDDNFDSYADDAAFEAVWRQDTGNGTTSTTNHVGFLVPRIDFPLPPAPFDGTGDASVVPPVDPIVGKAVTFPHPDSPGSINEWDKRQQPQQRPFFAVAVVQRGH